MATAATTLRRYHEATKHSRQSVGAGSHRLDWTNKPLPFKIYTGLEGIKPPHDLSRLCLYSNGVLRWREQGSGGAYGFRAAACTGALYHIELYLAAAGREDLPAGLYHYGARDHALRLLRPGDVRGALVRAGRAFEPLARAPLIAILTSTFWRNAWKYQARAYRHAFWDSGTILANLLELATGDGQPASVAMGFADVEVNQILGVDGEREAALALVAIGHRAPEPLEPGLMPALDFPTEPLSRREIRYREIEEAHRASSLASGDEVAAWRAGMRAATAQGAGLLDDPVQEVITRRRSARRFSRRSITRAQLERVLAAATSPIAGDVFGPGLVEPFMIVNAVEGLEPGAYRQDLTLIRAGNFRRAAGELALWQPLGADAAVNIYWLTDMDPVLKRLGQRGYRVAQTAGAIAGGRLDLVAAAAGLGATGLTFFDDEVTQFFEPASAGRQVMYLAAVGQRQSNVD